ncbi:MAG: PD-(D/E)XK nuclease family protein [Saprospiraceae bacterium]
MIIQFGLALDDISYPLPPHSIGGFATLGPKNLLYTLESHLGFTGYPNDNDYLRIEQYRQALLQHLQVDNNAFYLSSFAADQFATATELLSRRDELLLAGWDFSITQPMPTRLATLAAVESLVRAPAEEVAELPLVFGYADRWKAIIDLIDQYHHPLTEIRLTEPFPLLPYYLQRFFKHLEKQGVKLVVPQEEDTFPDTDLGRFQQRLQAADKEKIQLKGDGSLLLIQGKRETDIASYLAKIFQKNTGFKPLCLIPDKSRVLDNALIKEGLPSMGILSASLARPTLQVLKLVTVFLWEPINPYKILEFVSLSIKPLHDDLAKAIANYMAQYPGLGSDGWNTMIHRFFEYLENRNQYESQLKPWAIREEFEFWFNRPRYDVARVVPKEDVLAIFDRLHRWAHNKFEEDGNQNQSLIVLGEQAKRIVDLLQTLPETHLSYLELERIVKTIYEPAPVEVQAAECHHMPFIHHPAALTDKVDQLLWWNFTQHEPDHFFSRWYLNERKHLQEKAILLVGPQEENAVMLWQRKNPLLKVKTRLVLVIPELVEGSVVHAHPLFGDLAATFTQLSSITWSIDEHEEKSPLMATFFALPKALPHAARTLGKPPVFINIDSSYTLAEREQESLTSLEDLFYYPYQWVFKHKIKLRKSTILSVVKEHTLMGNLAHRFFEKLFGEDVPIDQWNKEKIASWIDQESEPLLKKEGAIFLLYGREPEKVAFLKKVKYAAWNLIYLIQKNQWEVEASEKTLEGKFQDIEVKGRADLVLKRGEERAILDLKWRGASRRESMIKNGEDLQLVLYARLLSPENGWAHTAYYVMDRARLIARNTAAFQEINPVSPGADHLAINQQIYDRMASTFHWRMQQIKAGNIEVRCEQTTRDLEEHYGEALLPVLEMKSTDAPFDDYRTLINLIE